MSNLKQKDTKSSAEWHFRALTGQLTSIFPNSSSIFHNFSQRFTTFLFLYLTGSVRSPDAKRTQIWPWYVGLIEVKHEIKATSMTERLNISFTSLTRDFLWIKEFQN